LLPLFFDYVFFPGLRSASMNWRFLSVSPCRPWLFFFFSRRFSHILCTLLFLPFPSGFSRCVFNRLRYRLYPTTVTFSCGSGTASFSDSPLLLDCAWPVASKPNVSPISLFTASCVRQHLVPPFFLSILHRQKSFVLIIALPFPSFFLRYFNRATVLFPNFVPLFSKRRPGSPFPLLPDNK